MKQTEKRNLLLIALMIFSIEVFAQGAGAFATSARGIGTGIGLGTLIAVIASWSRNESILWAIFHGFLGWIYVIYFVLTRRSK